MIQILDHEIRISSKIRLYFFRIKPELRIN